METFCHGCNTVSMLPTREEKQKGREKRPISLRDAAEVIECTDIMSLLLRLKQFEPS